MRQPNKLNLDGISSITVIASIQDLCCHIVYALPVKQHDSFSFVWCIAIEAHASVCVCVRAREGGGEGERILSHDSY
jgi:hypothetical protein